jgi:MFS superfamily sulfate permease-like transporter
VLVPESLAHASIAGVPRVIGLYAAPAGLLLYAAFGSGAPAASVADSRQGARQ